MGWVGEGGARDLRDDTSIDLLVLLKLSQDCAITSQMFLFHQCGDHGCPRNQRDPTSTPAEVSSSNDMARC